MPSCHCFVPIWLPEALGLVFSWLGWPFWISGLQVLCINIFDFCIICINVACYTFKSLWPTGLFSSLGIYFHVFFWLFKNAGLIYFVGFFALSFSPYQVSGAHLSRSPSLISICHNSYWMLCSVIGIFISSSTPLLTISTYNFQHM